MNQNKAQAVALMRYAVIAPLISGLSDAYPSNEAFFRDAADYFPGKIIVNASDIHCLFCLIISEIMNCLHNYVVNDTPSFLSQPDRIETVFEMCKHVSDFNRLYLYE